MDEAKEMLQSMFTDIQLIENEEKGEVKFMGNMTKENVPPEDTSNWKYGEQIVNSWEHIYPQMGDCCYVVRSDGIRDYKMPSTFFFKNRAYHKLSCNKNLQHHH